MTTDRHLAALIAGLCTVAVVMALLWSDTGDATTAPSQPTFGVAGKGPQVSSNAMIMCDPHDFVHTQLPTMTDTAMVVVIGGVTRTAVALYGTRTWDGAERAVYNAATSADGSGRFEVLEPHGPVALACVDYESVRTR